MKYLIKKDTHYSIHLPGFSFSNKFQFIRVKFDSSCLYKFNNVDDGDVNKLIGYTFGLNPNPHKNSFRLGWNCQNGRISLFAYAYINSERIVKYLCDIDIDKWCNVIYYSFNGKMRVSVDDTVYYTGIDVNRLPGYGWKLYPYFGGNNKAPQTMLIEIQQNKFSYYH